MTDRSEDETDAGTDVRDDTEAELGADVDAR